MKHSRLGVFLLSLALLSVGACGATARQRAEAALAEAHYQYGVIEYCGFVGPEVEEGFVLQTRDLAAAAAIGEARYLRLRIDASLRADYQYGNHGLSGFKHWCRRDGVQAVWRFLAYREAATGKPWPFRP